MEWIARWGLVVAIGMAGRMVVPGSLLAQELSGPLVVFNAGSLAAPFRDLLQAFGARHPRVQTRQESSGSLEAARKLTELGKVPDVLGVADYLVIPKLLIPGHATWYIAFARNAMVLIHSRQSVGADIINGGNWQEVLLRPGVRTGRSDPALDPNGYRTLLVLQLAEAHLRQPGLAARLLRAMPERWMRPKEADLVALVQAGELDYAWSYRSIAVTLGLPFVALPPEVDLSDPRREAWYSRASIQLPGARLGATDSITVPGEPIVYALTIPSRAEHRVVAEAFVRFVLSPEGRAIVERNGLTILSPPRAGGPDRPPATVLP